MIHNFGVVLAHDQTLSHEFRLANPSDQAVRIRDHEVRTPCCSGLGPLPATIPARGDVVIPAFLKAGHTAEQKRVAFVITTNDPAVPDHAFVLEARFLPDWEVRETASDPSPVLIGRGLTRTYDFKTRRRGDEGLAAPVDLTTAEPLVIPVPPTRSELTTPDGIIECTQSVTVQFPPNAALGSHRGAILARWPDGSRRAHEIAWAVEPKIRLAPSVLLVKAEDGPVSVRVEVRGREQPFRVVSVAGPLLIGAPSASEHAAPTHSQTLTLDGGRLDSGSTSSLTITTDDPDQPRLTLGVVVIPRREEKP